MHTERPFVITIAGFDPSGGAGLLADIKTMEQLKVVGLSVCTAITIQTGSECLNIEWQPLDEILLTLNTLMQSYSVDVVKIGVIKDAIVLNKIIETIKSNNCDAKIIWDPVLKSTSDFSFFDLNGLPLLETVLKQIDVLTPNFNEYQVLTEKNILKENEFPCAVLLKGGHRKDQLGTDILFENGKEISLQPTYDDSIYFPKHGSGCVLSSAIASWLAKGETLENACVKGKLYIEQFLKSNPSLLGYHSN